MEAANQLYAAAVLQGSDYVDEMISSKDAMMDAIGVT